MMAEMTGGEPIGVGPSGGVAELSLHLGKKIHASQSFRWHGLVSSDVQRRNREKASFQPTPLPRSG